MRFLSIAILLYFSTFCLAETTTSTPYVITGLTSQYQLGELTFVGQDSKPVLKQVGLIEVNKDATNVSVVAFNSKFDIVVATLVAPNTFVIDQPGSWIIVIRGEKVEGLGLSKLVIGTPDVPTPIPPTPPDPPNPPDPPTPPTPPNPPIPTDDFDNLGQRLDKLADSLNLLLEERLKFSEIYYNISKKMKEFKVLKVSDAVKQLTSDRDALNLPSVWNNINKMIYDDGGQRVMSREEVIIWYNVIADGIKG